MYGTLPGTITDPTKREKENRQLKIVFLRDNDMLVCRILLMEEILHHLGCIKPCQ